MIGELLRGVFGEEPKKSKDESDQSDEDSMQDESD